MTIHHTDQRGSYDKRRRELVGCLLKGGALLGGGWLVKKYAPIALRKLGEAMGERDQAIIQRGVAQGIEQGRDEAFSEVVEGLKDFVFNRDLQETIQSDYGKERAALEQIRVVSNGEPAASASIDDLFRNTVMISNLSIPNLPAEDLLYEMWDLTGRKEDPDATIWRSHGWSNGYVISKEGHVLTALHVVDDAAFNDYRKFVVMDGQKKISSIEGVLAYSRKYDIALLKMAPLGDDIAPVVLLDEASLKEGAKVHNIGRTVVGNVKYVYEPVIALANPNDIQIERYTSTGNYRGILPHVTMSIQGTILGRSLKTDSFSRGGFSGSVTVDNTGRIIGIHSMSNPKTAYAAPASAIKGMIDFYLEQLKLISQPSQPQSQK